ncbi:MAG: hypothetical protein PHW32_03485, partial [Bacilli bacterium]|nr:hypothetical protein [Bacilli bacterium]
MDFINDNYVWFIVIGVILFMALIGYIAEKTDFGRSQFEKRVKREPKPKKEKVKKASTTVIEELPVAEANVENAIDEAVVIEDDDWLKPLEEPIDFMENNNETNEENLTVPLEGINPAAEEDLTVPLEGINPVVEEDLTVPLEGINPVVEEDLTVPL